MIDGRRQIREFFGNYSQENLTMSFQQHQCIGFRYFLNIGLTNSRIL